MIENIRKYRGIIIFALVLVGIALVIGFQNDLVGRSHGQRDLFKISGRAYSDVEYQRLGDGGMQLTSSFAQTGDIDFYQLMIGLTSGTLSQKDFPVKFFISRMVLRDAKESFGIHPGEQEISDYIRKMRFFMGPDQKFSEEKYQTFVDKSIGRLGLTEHDLRELISDLLTYKKINSIVGSGLSVNRDIAARSLALRNQMVYGHLARIDVDPIEAKIQPTDEEIKTYWENTKDAFRTAPLRKFTYVIVTPDMPKDEAEPEETKKGDSIVDAAATDEAKKKQEAEKAKKAAERAEARRKKQLETDSLVDDFSFQLDEQHGKGFEELIKSNKWEVKTTELFAQATPPKDLDIKLRASSQGGKAADELFRISPTSDPLSSFTQPIAIGENQWLIARLDGQEEARNKTFEEARAEAKDRYIQEKAAEAMKTAANEALEKIKAGITAGKSFADAAKEAGITETKEITKVGSSYRADAATEPRNLFEATSNVDPGGFAEIITESDRAFIVHVTKREVVKEENAALRLETEVNSNTSNNEMAAFIDWMSARIEAAKVEELFKQS